MRALVQFCSIVLLFAITATEAAAATTGAPPGAPPATPSTQPASQPAAAAELDPIIDAVDFNATPLGKAFDTLRDRAEVNIVVRWQVLNAAGVDADAPVNLRVANLPLQRLLELVGEAGGAHVPLAAREDRGVVVVTTQEDARSDSTLRLYDVRELIESDMAISSRVKIGRATTTPATLDPEERYEMSLDRLKQVIHDTIEPESWREAGGTIGAIHHFNGLLIITHAPPVHDRISKLLDELRRK